MALNIRLAKDSDNDRLLKFYRDFTLKAEVSYSIERKKNFFQFYESSCRYYECYIIEEGQEIKALVSFQLKQGLFHGQLKNYTWVTDMRISPERNIVLFWARNFLNLLKDFNQRNQVQFSFTVVSNADTKTYNTLIRPRLLRKNFPRYQLIRNFDWVNIHGTLPLQRFYIRGIKVTRMQGDELEELCQYFIKSKNNSLMQPDYSEELLNQDILKVPGFDLGNFFIARDKQKNIIGCLGFMRNHYCQSFNIHSYSSISENFKNITRLLSPFGLIKALPPRGQEAKFIYLRFLYADNPDILQLMMLKVLKDSDKNEFLVYPHFHNSTFTSPPSSFLHSALKFGLYSLILPEDKLPSELLQNPFSTPPYIDIAFL